MDGPKVGDLVYLYREGGWSGRDITIHRAVWLEVVKVTPSGQFVVRDGKWANDEPKMRRFKPLASGKTSEIGATSGDGWETVLWGDAATAQHNKHVPAIRRAKLARVVSGVVGAIESRENRNDPSKLISLADELKAAAQALLDHDASLNTGSAE